MNLRYNSETGVISAIGPSEQIHGGQVAGEQIITIEDLPEDIQTFSTGHYLIRDGVLFTVVDWVAPPPPVNPLFVPLLEP